jgi:hypothetical protein
MPIILVAACEKSIGILYRFPDTINGDADLTLLVNLGCKSFE